MTETSTIGALAKRQPTRRRDARNREGIFHGAAPAGWPRISSGVFYRDAACMVDRLCDAFGFAVQRKVTGDGGGIVHRTAGARIVDEPAVHDYGDDHWADRSYGAADPEDRLWWFTQRIRG